MSDYEFIPALCRSDLITKSSFQLWKSFSWLKYCRKVVTKSGLWTTEWDNLFLFGYPQMEGVSVKPEGLRTSLLQHLSGYGAKLQLDFRAHSISQLSVWFWVSFGSLCSRVHSFPLITWPNSVGTKSDRPQTSASDSSQDRVFNEEWTAGLFDKEMPRLDPSVPHEVWGWVHFRKMSSFSELATGHSSMPALCV